MRFFTHFFILEGKKYTHQNSIYQWSCFSWAINIASCLPVKWVTRSFYFGWMLVWNTHTVFHPLKFSSHDPGMRDFPSQSGNPKWNHHFVHQTSNNNHKVNVILTLFDSHKSDSWIKSGNKPTHLTLSPTHTLTLSLIVLKEAHKLLSLGYLIIVLFHPRKLHV